MEDDMAYDEDDQMTLSQFTQSKRGVAFDQVELPSGSGHDKAKQCAKERAEEIQANLDPQFPSLVKTMTVSHVTPGYWMGLPSTFCNLHLQKQDLSMTLVDEDQKEYITKFLFESYGLSAGWKAFSAAHNLVEGDAVVFQLVEDTKFQVYIVRAYSLGAIEGNAAPVTQRKNLDLGNLKKQIGTSELTPRKCQRPDPLVSIQPLKEETFGNHNEEDELEVLEGIRVWKHTVEFKDVKNFESFSIVVNDLIIDSSFSLSTRTKYYKLCCSQEAFLHDNLLKGMNMKFATGAISQAVDLAESIKASKFTTSLHLFEEWDKSLEALETIGMNVCFLRDQLERLIVYKSEAEQELKRCKEAQVLLSRVEEEIKPVKAKLAELKNACKVLGSEVETRREKASRNEMNFQCEVDSPW